MRTLFKALLCLALATVERSPLTSAVKIKTPLL